MKDKYWTEDKNNLLRRGVNEYLLIKEIQIKYFPDKSPSSIKNQMSRLKLKCLAYFWSKKSKKLLKKGRKEGLTIQQIQKKYLPNYSPTAIQSKISKEGLPKQNSCAIATKGTPSCLSPNLGLVSLPRTNAKPKQIPFKILSILVIGTIYKSNSLRDLVRRLNFPWHSSLSIKIKKIIQQNNLSTEHFSSHSRNKAENYKDVWGHKITKERVLNAMMVFSTWKDLCLFFGFKSTRHRIEWFKDFIQKHQIPSFEQLAQEQTSNLEIICQELQQSDSHFSDLFRSCQREIQQTNVNSLQSVEQPCTDDCEGGSCYHYVYIIICNHPNTVCRFYIGKRSSILPPEEDSYMSSSRFVKKAIEFFGEAFFQKKVIQRCPNEKAALKLEGLLHQTFDVANHPLFFNQSAQTSFPSQTNDFTFQLKDCLPKDFTWFNDGISNFVVKSQHASLWTQLGFQKGQLKQSQGLKTGNDSKNQSCSQDTNITINNGEAQIVSKQNDHILAAEPLQWVQHRLPQPLTAKKPLSNVVKNIGLHHPKTKKIVIVDFSQIEHYKQKGFIKGYGQTQPKGLVWIHLPNYDQRSIQRKRVAIKDLPYWLKLNWIRGIGAIELKKNRKGFIWIHRSEANGRRKNQLIRKQIMPEQWSDFEKAGWSLGRGPALR